MDRINVAVITPYYKETDDVLRTCLTSVRNQDYKNCRHFLVADGFPNPTIADWNVQHIILPSSHHDTGNLARAVGAIAAVSEGYDAIAFLDADNWYRADHLARLIALFETTGAQVCTAGRTMHRLDGSLLGICQVNDGSHFVDTSCLCIFRPAFHLLPLWALMPARFGAIGDRVVWAAIRERRLPTSHSPEPTVAFRTQYAWDYTSRGETPPPGAKVPDETQSMIKEFNDLPVAEKMFLLSGVPPTLRAGPKN